MSWHAYPSKNGQVMDDAPYLQGSHYENELQEIAGNLSCRCQFDNEDSWGPETTKLMLEESTGKTREVIQYCSDNNLGLVFSY